METLADTDVLVHWRDEAVNEALHASAYADGNCSDVLLRAVRQHHPDTTTLTKWLDRPQLLRFLEREATGLRRLIRGGSLYTGFRDEGGPEPYFDWLAATWEGRDLEIVLPPGCGTGWAHCVMNDAPALERLSALRPRLRRRSTWSRWRTWSASAATASRPPI